MANLREGVNGQYYGSFYGESEPLTQTEMELNATYIYNTLAGIYGWTINAVCGLLGNLQAESTMNPGRWQSDNVGSTSNGYGLVQWTPATKYLEWVSGDASTMDNNLSRLLYEVSNRIQWIPTDDYPLSFAEFSISSKSIDYLAKAFLLCYERPADQSESVQNYRSELANNWYKYFGGVGPDVPTAPKDKKKKYNFVIHNARRRRERWIK